MARDPIHGGNGWAFGECVWAPAEKERGGDWPHWTRVKNVRQGDAIFHLRGIKPSAEFVGYSIAAEDGFETTDRPPQPGQWAWSNKFVRANLKSFTPFPNPINLLEIFAMRDQLLRDYLDRNASLPPGQRKRLFYSRPKGILQCYNGGYFSDLDEALFEALFGTETKLLDSPPEYVSVTTGQILAIAKQRIGQSEFAAAVKAIYGNRCCYPGCPVTNPRFLVGAHIARWSDNEGLRGNFGNGISLCVFHDKAFEVGLFTLTPDYRVHQNPSAINSPESKLLAHGNAQKIHCGEVLPLIQALEEHWKRIGCTPMVDT